MVNKVQALIDDELTPIITLTLLLNISDKIIMPKIKDGHDIKDQSC